MDLLEDKLLKHVNLDPNSENILLSLVSDLNAFLANYPNLDLSSLIDNISCLVNTQDKLARKNSDLVEKNNELFIELLKINSKFESFKAQTTNELNDSFKMNDLMVEEKDSLNHKLIIATERSTDLQSQLQLAKKENYELLHAISNKQHTCIDSNTSNNNDVIKSLKTKLEEKDNNLTLVIDKLERALESNNNLKYEIESMKSKLHHISTDKWLDDRVLEGYFTSFQKCDRAVSSKTLLIGPLNCEILKLGSCDVVAKLMTDLEFVNFNFALCCISNTNVSGIDEHVEGGCKNDSVGSHWSLLFLDLTKKSIFHFDSLNPLNLDSAHLLIKNMGLSSWSVMNVPCPQQNNSFECGLNVLMYAKLILYWYCSENSKQMLFNVWFENLSVDFQSKTYNNNIDCTHELKLVKTGDISHFVNEIDITGNEALRHDLILSNKTSLPVKLVEPIKLKRKSCNFWEITTNCNNTSRPVKISVTKPLALSVNKVNCKQWKIVNCRKGSQNSKVLLKYQCTDIPLKNTFSVLDALSSTETLPSPKTVKTPLPKVKAIKTSFLKYDNSVNIKKCKTKFGNTFQRKVNSSKCNKSCVRLFSDSHGRSISSMLGSKLNVNSEMVGFVKPNAMFDEILPARSEIETMGNNDILILMGGTNNIVNGRCVDFTERLDDFLGTLLGPRAILEQKRKLFHTSVYESEVQLKKLYIQTCRRLPAHGCKVYQVKELLRGKTKKKAARLLGLGPDKIVLLDNKTKILAKSQNTSDLLQWRTGGGRSHDRLQLEFRATRWSLVVPSVTDMRQVGLTLWEILQELDCTFLEEHTLLNRFPNQDLVKRTVVPLQVVHSAELEDLQRLLHFPEEVALRLADTENELFYQVPPIDYLRQVTLDLGGTPTQAGDTPRTSVRALVKRFNEVSSWVTHLIISQPTHEDRKSVLSCILRVALSCWNIGNFNGAMEIVAGLKSNKLKPFWLSITEKETLPVLEFLSTALLSVEYDRALVRALAMPECRVVPFFGSFLRDLRDILSTTPSLVVLAPSGEHTHLEYISDYNGEDHYFTRIGPGGLINLDKIYHTQAVMDRIASFHQHFHHRERDTDAFIDQISIHTSSIERSYLLEEKEDETSELDVYQPVQPLNNDHGVSFFPISAPHNNINHHGLQIMHHGTTVVHWDAEGGSRSALVFLRLERSCATLTWSHTAWSGLKTSGATSTPDYSLSTNPEELIAPGLLSMGGEVASPGLDEGFLELSAVKEITLGARDRDKDLDLTNTLRRFNINRQSIDKCCLAIVYGANISDNRVLFLLCPPSLCWIWYHGLCSVVRGLKRQLQQSDRRIIWLKEQYLQLYYEDGCCGPLTVDAIRIFGGRDWADPGKVSGMSPPDNGTCKRGPSVKFKKKRSIGNIQAPKLDQGCSKMPDLSELVIGGTLKRQGPSSVVPPSRSRSISSEMEVPRVFPQSPHGSADHLDTSSPLHYSREKMKNEVFAQIRNFRHGSITHETRLDFCDFVALFRSFSLRSRKDLRELFDQLAMSCRSLSDSSLNDSSAKNSPEYSTKVQQKTGLITRNSSADLMEYKNTPIQQKKKIFDAIAASSIISNCAGVDTSKSQVITLPNFVKFLESKQMEHRTEDEVNELIQRHEPDPLLRSQHCLSFEGFARYMMDKENYAFVSERVCPDPNEMEYPLSHYYIASSHNTYLTGHQLKGESSVDLYSQVLLTGCRCVELDCWDGDDGSPLIYHGHTFTTKIGFRSVVEAINRSAFVTSPYPVILSIENHCSLQQQTRMAQIFLTVFGDKLVTKFLFEADFGDEPQLPSPLQLKYRILVKNKKLTAEIPMWPMQRGMGARSSQRPPQSGMSGTGRASSIISNTSGGSVNDDFSDDDDDDDDDDDENIDGGGNVCPRTDSMSSHESVQKTPLRCQGKSPAIPQVDVDWSGYLEDEPNIHKAKKQSSQIAKDLSDLVIYVQAIKFRGLNTISPNSSVRCKRAAVVAATTSSAAMLKKGSGSSVTLASSGSPGASVVDSHSSYSKQRPNSNHPCYQTSSLNENSAKKLCRKQPHALIAHTETQLVRTYPAGMRIDSSNFNPVIFWAFGIQMVALNYQTDDASSHLNAAMFEQNGRCGYVPKPPVMRDRSHMMYRRFNPWEKEFDGLHSCHLIINLISGQYCCPNTVPGINIVVEVELVGIPVDCNKQRTKSSTRNFINPIFNETFFFKVMFRDLAFLRFNVLDQNTNHILTQRVMPLKCLRPGYRHVRLRSSQNQPLPLSSLFICSRTEEESLEGAREAKGTIQEVRPDSSTNLPGVKRRMFFLMVYGVVPDEPYTILKITQESTTQEVILQALTKANVGSERAGDYVLVEEVARGWGGREKDMPASQRVLDPQERPLQAQAQWQGVGKFLLKRLGDDPSSRAWLSSIRSTRNVKQARTWDEADNFLVCVYNVSPEIPYAILKVPLSACAQDVLAQALVKARRLEDPVRFVLVEELEWQSGGGRVQRILADEENIFRTQAHWQTIGRFILKEREVRKTGTLRPALDRLSKGLSATLSDPTTTAKAKFPLSGLGRRGSTRDPVTPTTREVHSEGETLSDDDGDLRNRLKRVSFRKLKVWKS